MKPDGGACVAITRPSSVERERRPDRGEDRAHIDLSVVLVNWNSLRLTSDALASIEQWTKDIRYEVFVIDNGTTKDESVAELPRRFPWIRFIANGDNRGFSKANNQGIRRSNGRYILVLNNDTIQIENALGKAVAYMDSH